MNFTFGIITTKQDPELELKTIIESIKNLFISNYEILIVGGSTDKIVDNIKIFSFILLHFISFVI